MKTCGQSFGRKKKVISMFGERMITMILHEVIQYALSFVEILTRSNAHE